MAPRSMTGFGRGEHRSPRGSVVAEVKSVNSRFLEIQLRLPPGTNSLELPLRERVSAAAVRGRIDVMLWWEPASGILPEPRIDREILASLARQATEAGREFADLAAASVGDLLRVRGVVEEPSAERLDAAILEHLLTDFSAALDAALQRLVAARQKEGAALTAALAGHIDELERRTAQLADTRGEVIERYRQRLRDRIAELLNGGQLTADPGRLEVEVALFADRADIAEEIDRLRAHIATFRGHLTSDTAAVGRTLDFLTQELLRETNTVGSKSRNLANSQHVLAMKNAIESLKEQVNNVE